jgi:hypothetical protein
LSFAENFVPLTLLAVMETFDINYVLQLYLGADANGGFQPIGCDERLRSAFPSDYSRLMQLMTRYLGEDHVPDCSKRDLVEERDLFAGRLRQKFPELDDMTVRALANRWSFGYK